MELVTQILGYGFIAIIVIGIFYLFTKILVEALGALTKNDD